VAAALQTIYRQALSRCAPDVLVREHIDATMPRNVVAIGKCAGALLDGVAAVHPIDAAFAALPKGYPPPRTKAEVHLGGHPRMTRASFEAGAALLNFVDEHDDILFLVSGGGSACVEVALRNETETANANERLIVSGWPIAQINEMRRKYSAIKGGRLRERVRGRCVTLVYSDVSKGALADVASGPTITGASEAVLIADNSTLTATAAQIIGDNAVLLGEQIECDVEDAADLLAKSARKGRIVVAGGEPTVVVRGPGRGGRCMELGVRFAMKSGAAALFGSSDGVDGTSGAAGIVLPPRHGRVETTRWQAALAASDSSSIAAQVGEPIMIAPTGNNLRDLFLVASE
jgi:glycerate 2-kinase